MPIFKVWNRMRTIKKSLVAKDLEELKKKGCERLSIQYEDLLNIVLENDGTEIEDEDVILELSQTGEIFMFLQKGEHWGRNVDVVVHGTEKPNEAVNSKEIDVEIKDLTPQDHINCNEIQLDNDCTVLQVKLNKYALPKFSPLVEKHLKEKKVEVIWNKLIAEVAQHYFSAYPMIGDSSHYKDIGEKMYLAYPCIKMESGSHPWSFFTKSLSQKIRHLRHNLKMKSQLLFPNEQNSILERTPPSKKFRVMPETPKATASTEEEIKSHLSKLKEEWKKLSKNRDVGHIKMLLRETIEYRDNLLKKNPDGLVKAVTSEFHCFTDALYVLFDFSVRFGNDKLQESSNNLKKIIPACLSLMNIKDDAASESSEKMIDVILYIEMSTKFDRNKSGGDAHFKSIIKVFEDAEDSDIKKKLVTKEKVPPHLATFKKEGTITGTYIVGDDTVIKCQGSSLTAALMQLVALYYIFDINYPKCYAMLLGFLQIFVMQEPFTYETSKKFKFFLKKFRPVFEKIEMTDNKENSQSVK